MAASHLKATLIRVVDLAWVGVIYLASELAIWGLSCVLASVDARFFASILGMLVVFVVMAIAVKCHGGCETFYQTCIRSKVDFINIHLSVGFSVPMAMLDPNDVISASSVALVIANFVITNVALWAGISILAFFSAKAALHLGTSVVDSYELEPLRRPLDAARRRQRGLVRRWSSVTAVDSEPVPNDGGRVKQTPESSTPIVSRRSFVDCTSLARPETRPGREYLKICYPIVLSFLCALAIGVPLAVATGDQRALDGCMLWFVWITAVRIQRLLKQSSACASRPRFKGALATLANPVLLTALIMAGFVRVKAAAATRMTLPDVLDRFSSGTPLYALWSSAVTGEGISANPTRYFGAGDAALSLLEVGILVWGFKLYECRRQLFSIEGIATALMCIVLSAINVFASTAIGRTIGLGTPEALAFAARSTTLALARPAMQTAGGNLVVNAALVVSNGILGQLVYPYALRFLTGRIMSSPSSVTLTPDGDNGDDGEAPRHNVSPSETDGPNDAATIATGVTIGINGVAMGVVYLYEAKHRAAPYAALAMTVSGVVTVVLATVDPFKSALIALASY